ncbi:interferon alpha/beta receptor 1-like isoform X3 [Syngnathus typhle]|uniref:interferon alpha/beta receptor 1-like isoform X3 n=1 Tax=Syngnathus typhle TaxID=161592 RepID=UPI002A6B81F6|nr:interferon alpha/beta receptor 1-like isoform X3 [Syngnathus typhle]
MASIILNALIVILTSGGTTVASAVLSPPRNVRLTSMNMNLVLRWDSPEGLTGDISYTTECNTSVRICHVGCVNISTLECDFSSLNTFLSVYGRYKARVRAQRGENHSSWVESKPITLESDSQKGRIGLLQLDDIPYRWCPPAGLGIAAMTGNKHLTATAPISCFKDGLGGSSFSREAQTSLSSATSLLIFFFCLAMIGSPNVSLISNGATIGISVKDPTFAISDLRSVYGTATYNITYWKDGQNEKAKHISSVLQNQIFLNDLDPGTKYCVQVQIIAESNTKPSNPSSTVCESTTNVSEHLPPPQKVDFITLNTNYTLKWEWNRATSKSQAVSFSVQYMSHFTEEGARVNRKSGKYKLESKKRYYWSNACDKTFSKSCDLTAHNLHYLGFYMLRVRTNDNSSHSEWVQKEFCPEKHAAIGPPSKVELAVAVNNIDVFISDPLTSSNRSMRQNLKKLHYYIVYWEHNVDKQVLQPQIIHTSAQMVTLPDLNYWTLYCVRVQSCSDHPDKRSKFNLPYCIQTDGHTPWWQTVMYFLGSLLMACTVVLLVLYILFRCYSIFKATFYPLIQLPSFFHKYPYDYFGSDIPCLLSMESEAELFCDRVTICEKAIDHSSKVPPMSSLGLEPASGSSGLYSHQDMRRNEDSGVYSTEGSECQHQKLNSSQSSLVACQGPDLDSVKMHDKRHQIQCGITVEDFVDGLS